MSHKIKAKIILDSIAPSGARLVTFEVVVPRFLLAEINTHRALSRNYESNRARSFKSILKQVTSDPYIPIAFGKKHKGMQHSEELSGARLFIAKTLYIAGAHIQSVIPRLLSKIGLSKQLTNRFTECYQRVQGVISATELKNFFNLRLAKDAESNFRRLAYLMDLEMKVSTPRSLKEGDWHLPYITDHDISLNYSSTQLAKISGARCARVSYANIGAGTPEDSILIANKLISSGHMSPFEHQATASTINQSYGNFKGFKQFRKTIEPQKGE